MVERRVRVADPAGLHLRQAARIVQLASRFDSRIVIRRAGREADARSVLAILGLAVGPATEVTLAADGADAEEALDALADELAARGDEVTALTDDQAGGPGHAGARPASGASSAGDGAGDR